MTDQFDLDYEAFKQSLPNDLTNVEYERRIKDWLNKKERNGVPELD